MLFHMRDKSIKKLLSVLILSFFEGFAPQHKMNLVIVLYFSDNLFQISNLFLVGGNLIV